MKRLVCSTLALVASVFATAQDIQSKIQFEAPFKFPLFIAGNFGEPRPNHMHAGLDFKTQGVEGKELYCVADGYISRITIGLFGFGNALYVTHPNGYTSVYCHLQKFTPEIAKFVKRYCIQHELDMVDIKLGPREIRVKQGELIAYSGNTGASHGPHLHFELHNTATDELVDPLPYFKHLLQDTIPPHGNEIMFYPQRGEGVINGLTTKQRYKVKGGIRGVVRDTINAWGKIGVGIYGEDMMNKTYNHYGIYSIKLFVDGIQRFESHLDKFYPIEHRMVNSWGDYDVFRKSRIWFLKSFAAPGNSLQMLNLDKNRGVIDINEERIYKFKYILEDHYGNRGTVEFNVFGKKSPIPEYQVPNVRHFLHWNRTNVVQEPGMELAIPRGLLYDDAPLNVQTIVSPKGISNTYRLHDDVFPLNTWATIMIAVRNPLPVETRCYYVAMKTATGWRYMGGRYNSDNGWVSGRVRDLGATYTVQVDTIGPRFNPIAKKNWSRLGVVKYVISDKESGLQHYKCKIDGKFALFTNKRGVLTCHLEDVDIQRNIKHRLEFVATDNCGNKTVDVQEFVY